MKRKRYEKELRKLQVKLCLLQDWIKQKGLRVIVVFEGRDTAGKGGTIKALTARVSPRVFRVVALASPSDRENDLTAFLYQRMRDYCIGMISSRWTAKGANVCGAGGL